MRARRYALLCSAIGSAVVDLIRSMAKRDVTFFNETGAFEISAGLDPESRDEALACIRREIDDLVTNGPRCGELDRAKRLTIAQSKLAFETTGSHAGWAGEGLLDFGQIPAPLEA